METYFSQREEMPTLYAVYGVLPHWWTCTILWLNLSTLSTASTTRTLFPSVWLLTTSRRASWCPLHASSQHSFGLFWYVVNWSVVSVLISDVWCGEPSQRTGSWQRWWKRGRFHGVPWLASGEVCQTPWSPMESVWWKCGSFPWSPMDSSVLDAGFGGVSRQLAADAVVCTVSLCDTTAGNGCSGRHSLSLSVTTAGIGMPWTLDPVKYLFLSVDDWDGWWLKCLGNTSELCTHGEPWVPAFVSYLA